LRWILNDSDDTLEFFAGKLSGTVSNFSHLILYPTHPLGVNIPLVEIDIGLLANQVGVTSTNTLDFC
jgi:hypothetical protein